MGAGGLRTLAGAKLSATIIRNGPRLFKDVSRRARIEQRPRGNTPGYIARATEIGLAARSAFRNGDTGNPRFHLDACFHNVLKRLAAPRGDAARKLFGFRGQVTVKKSSGECLGYSTL
jgi:hypothetical protein